jgi:glutamate decarboxylase
MLLAHDSPEDADLSPLFGRRDVVGPVPRYRLSDREVLARAAYQLVHDELLVDGKPLLNFKVC